MGLSPQNALYFIMLSFFIHKTFTFYIKDALKFTCSRLMAAIPFRARATACKPSVGPSTFLVDVEFKTAGHKANFGSYTSTDLCPGN